MKKLKWSLWATLIAVAVFTTTAFASEEPAAHVFDYAELFTAEEITSFEEKIAELQNEHNMGFAILTTRDTEGKNSRVYSDDIYEEKNIGIGNDYSGSLLLINMQEGEAYILTAGKMRAYLTDERIASSLAEIIENLSQRAYGSAVDSYFENVNGFILAKAPEDLHYYDEETGKVTMPKSITAFEFGISAVIAFAAAGIFCFSVTHDYSTKLVVSVYPFREKSTMGLTNQKDTFINKTSFTSRIPKPPSNSGGGGSSSGRSSSHTSSNGRSYGGGGAKF